MKHFVALLFVALVAIVTPARAALVYDGYATGPGGLSTPYPAGDNPQVYAGLLEANLGTPTLVMSADYNARVAVGDVQTLHIYTYADILAGAPVKFTAAQYARAAYILGGYFPMYAFPNSMIQTFAANPGNAELAILNTQIWDIMSSTTVPSFMGGQSVDNWNWSASMLIAEGIDTYLIPINTSQTTLVGGTVNATMTPSVPVPPAVWLFGSGLLGLVGVARRKK